MSRGTRTKIAVLLLASALLGGPLFGLDPSRSLTQYVHDIWNVDDGLPQATVRAIAQTRDGYLWLGTEGGLARFDGVRFTVFNRRTVPAFRENHVFTLLEDRTGYLWIGTHGGGLMGYRDGTFRTLTSESGLASDFVYALHQDREGSLWIGARRGVALLRDGNLVPFRLPVLQRTIWSIAQDRSGAMWIGTDLHGLARIENGVATLYTTATGLPHDAISVVRQLKDGRVLIGTNGAGVYEWSDGRFVPFRATGTLPSAAITALLEDSAGNLWIGTNGGLVRATQGVIVAGAPGELGKSRVNTLTEDREGSLWIGTTNAGLHRLRDGKVHTVTSAQGLPSDRIQTVLHDREGVAWIGTRDGLARVAKGKVTIHSTRDILPNDSVKSLFQSSDGAIWIGTDLGGVVRLIGDRARTTILDPDVPDNTIRAFAEQPGAGVWVGSNGGSLTLFEEGGAVRQFAPDARMPRLFVRAMSVDRNGALWVGTDGNGLFQFTDGKPGRHYTTRDGLSRDSIRSLYIDTEGTIWIGTDGGGLNRLQNGVVTAYGSRDGLFDDLVLQILEDGDGRLWMSCHNGIFAVAKQSLQAFAEKRIHRIDSFVIDNHDGMISRDCSGGSQPAGAKSGDGRLWFPTNEGVVIVDPRRLRRNVHPPPVAIEGVVADHGPVTARGPFELPRGTKNLEISYTALSLVVPQRVRFRYKLDGYDEEWIDAGTRRTAYYTALRPGQYRFRVTAANDDGIWNRSGATAAIHVPPYFYQRRTFVVLIILMIAAAIWMAVALRIRRIRLQAARTAEMDRRLIVEQRMNALGRMASGIAHDFNNTLMSAAPWAEIIRSDYPSDSKLQRAAEAITIAVDRARKVTSQLLEFAQPKQPLVASIDLVPLTREALSMARAVIPPEIDVQMKGDPQGVVAIADEAKISQVLLNLLLNARDAMPDGGRVTVDLRRPTASEAAAWNVDGKGFVVLSVSDSGSGMAPEVVERIFEPFYSTKETGRGTGLGLAVVHRIIEDHQGSIHVDSVEGKGTTFHVLLPAGECVQETEAAPVAPTTGTLRGVRVLLIDDEAVIVELIREVLESDGVSVEVATSGPIAFRLLDDGYRPDAIILDLGLPEMSGDRVHPLLRQRLPEVPIIISSGYGDRQRLDPLLQDSRTSYLQKPYPMRVLVDQVFAMTRAR